MTTAQLHKLTRFDCWRLAQCANDEDLDAVWREILEVRGLESKTVTPVIVPGTRTFRAVSKKETVENG